MPDERPRRLAHTLGALGDVSSLVVGTLARVSLGPLAGLAALGFIVLYVAIAVVHLRYPFELEWMEGGMVDEVRHLVSGGTLYTAPTVSYVPFIYAPIYFYVSAIVSQFFGVGFLSLRLVSVVSSLVSGLLLYRMVRRETSSRLFGLIAVGFFFATYKLGVGFLDLARVDSLFVALALGAVYVLRFHDGTRGQIVAAGLVTLMVFTKQSGVLLAAALVAWAVASERRRGRTFAFATAIASSATFLALNVYYRGWLYYYLFWIPEQHPKLPQLLFRYLPEDLFAPLAVLAVAAIGYLAFGEGRSKRLYGAALAGAIAVGWTGRIHAGGWPNVSIPAFAMLALVGTLGLALAASRLPSPRGRVVGLAAAIGQFAMLAYDPSRLVPTPEDRVAGESLIATLRAADGAEVFFPAHGAFLAMAGKKPMAQEMAMNDILGIGGGEPGKELRAEILEALAAHRFGAAVLDTDFLRPDVERSYRRTRDVFTERNVFFTVTGMRTRPRYLYVPK